MIIRSLLINRRKRKESPEFRDALQALSDMYSSLTLFDLEEGTITPLRKGETGPLALSEKKDIIRSKEQNLAAELASRSSREALYQFIRMDKIRERFGDLSHISHEFIDNDGKWNRLHFIVAERDSNGVITKILWALESIDEDKKRQEQFKNLDDTDSLTKILNRSAGESLISKLLQIGKHGMLLTIDADNFKYVNDSFGHDIGDNVLMALAQALKDSFRESDVIFRLGGDEFVVFVPGVDTESAGRLTIDRLFENVDKISFSEITDWQMHISVGAVMCSPVDKDALSVLYRTADKAMYQSKQHEGNYVTFARKLDP